MPKRYVPGRGPREARIAIVGEQPGKTEVLHGRPFIGPAGEELDKCLHTAGIIRGECYITNVIKDLDNPLKHYIDIAASPASRAKLHPEGQKYLEELKAELEYVRPNVVVAAGNVALYALTERRGITKWRGSVVPSSLVPKLKVVPCFHPSTILPKPPQHMGIYLNKHLIAYDLSKALKESSSPELVYPQPTIHTAPSFDEATEWLLHIYRSGICGKVVDFDIEVVNEELNCFAFCVSTDEAFCIPLVKGGDYWTIEQEAEIMKLTASILEHPDISIRGQNIAFDIAFMQSRYGIVTNGDIHDTMIAQKITMADYPAGLDFICSMHTSFPYYKGEGKKYMKVGGDIETFWNYNGRDVLATATAYPSQAIDLERQQNIETYDRQRRLVPILVYMQNRGIRVDVQGMIDGRKDAEAMMRQKEEELYSLVGYQINYNSPQQMQRYFYDEKGIPPYKKKNSKGGFTITCDVDALKRIARGTAQRAGLPEARLVMELRSLSTKTLGTYLSLDKIDPDGRYRSAYNPVGARTGRLSSSENIFGTGGNQQNWPHSLLKYLLADEGYIAYSIDLSQIENRIVAYVGRILEMIEAFEEGYDLHRLTAAMLFNKHPDDISAEDGSSDIGDGTHSERFWGKKSNHCKFRNSEVLTYDGWVSIARACHEGLQIAQWATDGEVSFVFPSAWYKETYSGKQIIIDNQRIHQRSTPDHRMPLIYKGEVIERKVSRYPSSGKYRAPLSGIYKSGTIYIKPSIMRLIVAFQADGSWNGNAMRIKVFKERKIRRLKDILDKAGIQYKDNPSGIEISAKSDVSDLVLRLIGKSKTFGYWLLHLDQESLSAFLSELPHWDGYLPKNQYFTTNKVNAEWVQTVAHLCGKAANISIQDNSKTDAFGNKKVYIVKVRTTVAPATSAIRKYVLDVLDETVYCPTVPSGYFLCKENGKISITGNSLNYDISYREFALKNEMIEKDAKFIIDQYHRAYPGVRGNYHEMVQSQLAKDRTLTNLFGRRRLFLDKWGRNLFKEAYAQIPQSTTADKINEQGLEYIYYNQRQFASLELLRQVHDDVGFQIPISCGFLSHAKMLLSIKKSLETPLEWHGRSFAVPADITMGLSFTKEEGHCIELKSRKVPNDPEALAKILEEAYHDILKAS